MTEIWKPIENFEDRYAISNLGNVKSYIRNPDGDVLLGQIDKKGYRLVKLYDGNGHSKTCKIHRLVAMAFIPNPNNYQQVNHKDEVKINNCVNNLEWCDQTYNINYGTKIQRTTEKNMCCESTSLKVYSVDENGHKEYYDSIGEAERATGLSHSNIVRTLKGRTRHCGKFEWHYQ